MLRSFALALCQKLFSLEPHAAQLSTLGRCIPSFRKSLAKLPMLILSRTHIISSDVDCSIPRTLLSGVGILNRDKSKSKNDTLESSKGGKLKSIAASLVAGSPDKSVSKRALKNVEKSLETILKGTIKTKQLNVSQKIVNFFKSRENIPASFFQAEVSKKRQSGPTPKTSEVHDYTNGMPQEAERKRSALKKPLLPAKPVQKETQTKVERQANETVQADAKIKNPNNPPSTSMVSWLSTYSSKRKPKNQRPIQAVTQSKVESKSEHKLTVQGKPPELKETKSEVKCDKRQSGLTRLSYRARKFEPANLVKEQIKSVEGSRIDRVAKTNFRKTENFSAEWNRPSYPSVLEITERTKIYQSTLLNGATLRQENSASDKLAKREKVRQFHRIIEYPKSAFHDLETSINRDKSENTKQVRKSSPEGKLILGSSRAILKKLLPEKMAEETSKVIPVFSNPTINRENKLKSSRTSHFGARPSTGPISRVSPSIRNILSGTMETPYLYNEYECQQKDNTTNNPSFTDFIKASDVFKESSPTISKSKFLRGMSLNPTSKMSKETQKTNK